MPNPKILPRLGEIAKSLDEACVLIEAEGLEELRACFVEDRAFAVASLNDEKPAHGDDIVIALYQAHINHLKSLHAALGETLKQC